MKIFLLRSDIPGPWTTSLHFGFASNGENLPWQEVNARKSTTDAQVQDTLILVVSIYECLSLYRWQWLMNWPPHIKVSSFALVEPHSLPASRVICKCNFLCPVRPILHIQICAGFLQGRVLSHTWLPMDFLTFEPPVADCFWTVVSHCMFACLHVGSPSEVRPSSEQTIHSWLL